MRFYTFIFAFFCSTLLSAQSSIPEPTRYISQQRYSSTTSLDNYERCFYFRQPNGLVDQFQVDLWDGTQFNLSNTRFYTYGANNLLTSDINRKWDAVNGYSDSERATYSYDASGNRTAETYEQWNTVTGIWETTRTLNMAYSATNKVTERTTYFFSNGQSFGNKMLYSYDTDDREAEVITQNFSNGTWNNQQKNVYFYNDSDAKVDVIFTDSWSAVLNDWVESSRTAYGYLPLSTTTLTETWSNGVWVNSTSGSMLYNTDNQVVSYINSVYTPQGLSPNSGYEIDYNADKSIHQFRYYYTDFSTNAYFQSLQIDYDYDAYTGLNNTLLDTEVTVFPNPTTDFLQVQVNSAHSEPLMYNITNLQGNLMTQGNLNASTTQIALQSFPAGAYFLNIIQNGAVKSVPVVKF